MENNLNFSNWEDAKFCNNYLNDFGLDEGFSEGQVVQGPAGQVIFLRLPGSIELIAVPCVTEDGTVTLLDNGMSDTTTVAMLPPANDCNNYLNSEPFSEEFPKALSTGSNDEILNNILDDQLILPDQVNPIDIFAHNDFVDQNRKMFENNSSQISEPLVSSTTSDLAQSILPNYDSFTNYQSNFAQKLESDVQVEALDVKPVYLSFETMMAMDDDRPQKPTNFQCHNGPEEKFKKMKYINEAGETIRATYLDKLDECVNVRKRKATEAEPKPKRKYTKRKNVLQDLKQKDFVEYGNEVTTLGQSVSATSSIDPKFVIPLESSDSIEIVENIIVAKPKQTKKSIKLEPQVEVPIAKTEVQSIDVEIPYLKAPSKRKGRKQKFKILSNENLYFSEELPEFEDINQKPIDSNGNSTLAQLPKLTELAIENELIDRNDDNYITNFDDNSELDVEKSIKSEKVLLTSKPLIHEKPCDATNDFTKDDFELPISINKISRSEAPKNYCNICKRSYKNRNLLTKHEKNDHYVNNCKINLRSSGNTDASKNNICRRSTRNVKV